MSELALEPYASQQRWQMPAPLAGRDWRELLVAYLAELARACAAAPAGPPGGPRPTGSAGALIGHIKLLALFPGGGYLRASAVSPVHRPTTDGQVPDGLAQLSLTLNVLVYGVPREVLAALARDTASALAAPRAGQVAEDTVQGMGSPPLHLSGNHPHPHAE